MWRVELSATRTFSFTVILERSKTSIESLYFFRQKFFGKPAIRLAICKKKNLAYWKFFSRTFARPFSIWTFAASPVTGVPLTL